MPIFARFFVELTSASSGPNEAKFANCAWENGSAPMTMQPLRIINGLLFLPPPPQRVSVRLRDRIMEEMRADLYGPPRYMEIENSGRSIVAIIDERWDELTQNSKLAELKIPERFRHWSDGAAGDDGDYLENWAMEIPIGETRQVLLDRIAAIRDDRPRRHSPRRPDWLVFLVNTGISRWHVATGKLPIATDSVELRAAGVVASPLFHTLRDMLSEMSPEEARLLTPHLFLSAIKRFRRGVEYTVLGAPLPPSRPRGRKRKQQPNI